LWLKSGQGPVRAFGPHVTSYVLSFYL